MRRVFMIVLLAIIAIIPATARAAAPGIASFEKTFKSPPVKYGSAPFWSWNDKLEKNELKRQTKILGQGGVGGFFMHARIGRVTPYLSKEWMDAVKLSVAEAKKNGMLAYLYDEDRWPSGFAGGIVPEQNPEKYMMRALVLKESATPLTEKELGENARIVRVFQAETVVADYLQSYKDVTASPKAAPGKTLLYFFEIPSRRSEWFNNYSYIDTMGKEAVQAFIDSTYEAYKKAVGNEFGKTVPGIFTDEPCYLMKNDFPAGAIPWTPLMPEVFKKKYGYDYLDALPDLYYRTKNSAKTRVDFYTNATQMFIDAFGKPIYEWCERNNIKFTGHYMCEDNLVTQTQWIGAAMPHYEYMQMPGIDHLGRNIKDVMTAKQLSSAAHQFDKPLTLSEMYGCAGWNFSFEGMKWIADWHYSLGVNFVNQHLSWYSMRGERKRDYPTCFNYQSAWWKYYKVMGDYITRTTFATSQGKYIADALVLHPSTSAWALYSPVATGATGKLSDNFVSLIMALGSSQIDYDFGDEMIIARHGKVTGAKFIVGKMSYSSVIIPSGVTMRATTAGLLKQFISNGGKVVAIAPMPSTLDGDKPFTLDGVITATDSASAISAVKPFLKHYVELAAEKGNKDTIYLLQMQDKGFVKLFFANTDNKTGVDVVATLPYSGRVRSWNLFTGAKEDYPSTTDGKTTKLRMHFEPAASFLLTVSPDEKPSKVKEKKNIAVKEMPLSAEWKIAKSDMNAITLDFMSVRKAGADNWAVSLPNYVAQEMVNNMGEGAKFQVRYIFNMGVEPKTLKRLFFIMEQPFLYKIELNGKPLHYTDSGWWVDSSFKKIDIRDSAVMGRNELIITGTYSPPKIKGTLNYVDNGNEIENAYVAGDFSVTTQKGAGYVIGAPSAVVKSGDMLKNGFPFFAGSIVISQEIDITPKRGESITLALDELHAITTKVIVNGKDAGLIAFHPHSMDITKFLKKGRNKIELELTNSNRNLLGPLHGFETDPEHVGPGTFRDMAVRKYNFAPFGILKGARIVISKNA